MIGEALEILAGWSRLDTAIILTAAVAAMACAVPGVFLVLRRQSMMGDALSHAVLPGIVLAYLATHAAQSAGWISAEGYLATRHTALFAGAVVLGMLTAVLTQAVRRLGRVEDNAALGVVFSSLFALGLLLVRLAADHVHLDPDWVLYGNLESAVLDTVAGTAIPRAAVVVGAMLTVNLLLVAIFFKELRIVTFDPALATTLGIPAQAVHYALLAVTAATLVAAFESVGSILVIAMLIVPAVTAALLTQRLGPMILVSLAAAAASAPLGHVLAIVAPPLIFGRLGYPTVVDASTAGMTAVAAGLFLVAAVLLAPGDGLVSRALVRRLLSWRIAGEDFLGILHRAEERGIAEPAAVRHILDTVYGTGRLSRRWIEWRLRRAGLIVAAQGRYQLTEPGRTVARSLVRSHRLFETYMARHFPLPDDHLHATAERVEHFIDPVLRDSLAAELDQPRSDPHGTAIPDD